MSLATLALIALLWILATLDAAFAGYRDATGRDPRVRKRRYFFQAMGRGALLAQAAVLIACVWIALTLWRAPEPAALWNHYLVAATHMLTIYLPSIAIVLIALCGFLAFPDLDMRVLATVLILGPFTGGRPLVILAGAAYTSWRGRESLPWSVHAFAWGSALMILAVGPILAPRWPKRPVLSDPA